jgi:hypothetical protein
MSSAAVKRKLSGSTDGMGIPVSATGSPGTTIHTAVAGTTPGTFDEVWLWASNNHSSDLSLTIEFGDATATHNIKSIITHEAGLFLVIPGLILQNSATVKAFSSVADVITVNGFVNSITD